jgi:hypothetical protein
MFQRFIHDMKTKPVPTETDAAIADIKIGKLIQATNLGLSSSVRGIRRIRGGGMNPDLNGFADAHRAFFQGLVAAYGLVFEFDQCVNPGFKFCFCHDAFHKALASLLQRGARSPMFLNVVARQTYQVPDDFVFSAQFVLLAPEVLVCLFELRTRHPVIACQIHVPAFRWNVEPRLIQL